MWGNLLNFFSIFPFQKLHSLRFSVFKPVTSTLIGGVQHVASGTKVPGESFAFGRFTTLVFYIYLLMCKTWIWTCLKAPSQLKLCCCASITQLYPFSSFWLYNFWFHIVLVCVPHKVQSWCYVESFSCYELGCTANLLGLWICSCRNWICTIHVKEVHVMQGKTRWVLPKILWTLESSNFGKYDRYIEEDDLRVIILEKLDR